VSAALVRDFRVGRMVIGHRNILDEGSNERALVSTG
jgi:hypothetical protein